MFVTTGPIAHPFLNRFLAEAQQCSQPQAEAKPSFMPSADITETADAYLLALDLPGVDPANLDIQAEKNVLCIKGERNIVRTEGESVNKSERLHGEFLRKFHLPESVNTAQISASAAFGVVTLRLPKTPNAAPVRIQVV